MLMVGFTINCKSVIYKILKIFVKLAKIAQPGYFSSTLIESATKYEENIPSPPLMFE